MKKIIYIVSLLSLVMLGGCKNEMEELFDESPDVRAEKYNLNNKKILVDQDLGWVGYYSSIDQIGAWKIAMKFNANGEVRLKSEKINISAQFKYKRFDEESSVVKEYSENIPVIDIDAKDETINYDIVTSQTSKLVFKSHCVLNEWHSADNLAMIVGHEVLTEPILGGEFQFTIQSATASRVELKSLTDKGDYKTCIVLTPATAADWNDVALDKVETIKSALKTKNLKYFRNLVVGDPKITQADLVKPGGQVDIDESNRVLRFSYLKDDKIEFSLHRFAITETGFVLVDSLTLADGRKITRFAYDDETDIFSCSDSDLKAHIEYSNTPGILHFPYVEEWGYEYGEEVSCALEYGTQRSPDGITVSPEFYTIGAKLSLVNGLKSFDFYLNTPENPSGHPNTITFKYNVPINGKAYVFNIDVPVEVERVANKCVIFSPKGDYKEDFMKSFEYLESEAPGFINKATQFLYNKISKMDVSKFNAEQKALYTADKLAKLDLNDRNSLIYLLNPKSLLDLLTNKSGYYMLPDIAYMPESKDAYKIVLMISVDNPDHRFVTEYFDFKRLN